MRINTAWHTKHGALLPTCPAQTNDCSFPLTQTQVSYDKRRPHGRYELRRFLLLNAVRMLTKSRSTLFTPLLVIALSLAPASFAAAQEKYPDDPSMPAYSLPDPLITASGRAVTTAEQWQNVRRPEILELFRTNVYGRVPATKYEKSFEVTHEDPKAMDGAATLRQVAIRIARGDRSLVIQVNLFLPNKATQPVPALVLICNRGPENIDATRQMKSEFWPAEEGIARGYAMAAFLNADVDPDRHDGFHDGIHGLLDTDPRPADAWGTLAAWAWGSSRVLDYLETVSQVNARQVAVIGHSRGGKTALWAAAEDQRFALACSNDSGCGGASISRRRFAGR